MELAFAGLHQLCAPMLGSLAHLPEPQQAAIGTAFGLRGGDAARSVPRGPGAARAAVRGGPRAAAPLRGRRRPVARPGLEAGARLRCPPAPGRVRGVGVRGPGTRATSRTWPACPRWWSRGLRDGDARALLDSVTPGRLDERVRDRIIAETRGNPLALLELPRGLNAAELAGGFGRPDAQPLASRIEQSFRRRLESLPAETQTLLLTAASEPVGDVTLLWRAAEELGIGRDAAAPAEAAGLIELGARVRFRHPLVRAAAYRAATQPALREAHRALAEATDPTVDPDRRAWHRANAAQGPDEEVAAELERSAARAQARGGVAAAAAFLERATELTADPVRRGPRALAAAEAKLDAGAPDAASALVASAELCPLDELHPLEARPAAGADRLRPPARERRPAIAVRGGEAARTPRRRTGARDVPRGAGGGDLRRSPRHQPGRGGDGRGGAGGAARAATSTGGGPAPGRPGVPLHRRLRRGGPSSPASPGGRPAGGGHPLVLAGLSHRVGAVGRRGLGGAGHPPGPDRPRVRRPRGPSPGAHLPLGHASARRRVRRHLGPDRGVGLAHECDRRRAAQVHPGPPGGLAGREDGGVELPRRRPSERYRTG